MSDRTDYEVLSAILSALPAEMKWIGGRNQIQGVKCPQYTLRCLSERGMVEVETRSCSPWGYGPKYPYVYKPAAMGQVEYDQTLAEYKAFESERNSRKFSTRSEFVARITDKGIEHLELLRTTRI